MTKPPWVFSRAKALLFLKQHPGTAGICSQCGCTHYNPCVFDRGQGTQRNGQGANPLLTACGWCDTSQTLCNNPICVAKAAEANNHAALQLPKEQEPGPARLPTRED